MDEDEKNLREKEHQVKQLNLMSERTNDVQPMFTQKVNNIFSGLGTRDSLDFEF